MIEDSKIKQIKKKGFIRAGELVKLTGVRHSTLRYYSDLGLLSFIQESEGLNKRYPREETLKRLKEIERLKKKRFTIEEIKEKLVPKLEE